MAAPNDARTALACPAIMYAVREIWATDAAGRFVLMSFPSALCGAPKEDAALAALARLTVVERAFSPGRRTELHEAAEAGCATRAGVAPLRLLGGERGGGESTGGEPAGGGVATIPWEPPPLGPLDEIGGARVCVYDADPGDPNGAANGGGVEVLGDPGLFVGAHRLDGRAARAVLAAAEAPPTDPACTVAASRFIVLHPLLTARTGSTLPTVTVELDGCERIVGTDLRARTAPPEVLAPLTR